MILADADTSSAGRFYLDIFKTCFDGILIPSTHYNQTKSNQGFNLQVPSKQARERRTSVKYGGICS